MENKKMAMPDSPIPPQVISGIAETLQKLAAANQSIVTATLTAAIVSARAKPTSIKEVLEIQRDLFFAMHPSPNSGNYQAWVKNKEEKLSKIYE
jgi:hypothetical protein